MTHVPRAFGVNIIGYLSSNSGVGVAARQLAELLSARKVPIAGFDLHRDPSTGGTADGFDAPCVAEIGTLPFAINLFVAPIFTFKLLERELAAAFSDRSYFNAAICFWELPTIPPRWIAPLERFDAIVATSDYMQHLYALALSGPWVISGRLPCPIPSGLKADRERFGLPPDCVVFVTSFEPASDSVRKNAAGVLHAFLRGGAADPRAYLAIKVKNPKTDGGEHAIVTSLRKQVGDHPRIKVITDDLSYDDVLTLYQSCDVFVSLHRAEGLGLGLLEAMAMGKPVIATGWSGNMSFMNHANSCLVRYRLVPVEASTKAYATESLEDTTVWAEPDLDHAAEWMKVLTDRPDLRRSVGEAALASYLRFEQEAMQAGFMTELESIRDQIRLHGVRPIPGPSISPTRERRAGRLARIQELERELNWITSRPLYRFARSMKSLLRQPPSS